jgi:hypothetical protein
MASTSPEACARKRTYLTADEALRASRDAYSSLRGAPTSLRAYRCNVCHKFHLGNHPALRAAR